MLYGLSSEMLYILVCYRNQHTTQPMTTLQRINITQLKASMRLVRERVLRGATYKCLVWGAIKAELANVSESEARQCPNQLSMHRFREQLTECWIAIEKDPAHPGFVICHYGKPWGIFRRTRGRSSSLTKRNPQN